MPLTIKKQDGKFCVTDPAGKNFGCHSTKQGAVSQIGAIESSKKSKSGIELAAADKNRILAAHLEPASDVDENAPPIMIISDGTPENTRLLINGLAVSFKRMDMYCNTSGDYPSCSVSITVEDADSNGLVVEKTLTLRKET